MVPDNDDAAKTARRASEVSLEGVYDPGNIFAMVIRGEASAAKVFEDDETLAFMDAFPQARGHLLVVHKTAAARNLMDIEPAALKTLILSVQRMTKAVRAALNPDGIIVTQFNGEASGQSVYHLHFHVIPRWAGTALGRHGANAADPAELWDLARRIAAEVS
jgi:histidine triad (HIT) family protein